MPGWTCTQAVGELTFNLRNEYCVRLELPCSELSPEGRQLAILKSLRAAERAISEISGLLEEQIKAELEENRRSSQPITIEPKGKP